MESCLAHRSDLALMRKLIFLLTIFLFTATPTPAGAADAIKGLLELPENLQEGPPTLQLKHFSLPVPTGRTKKNWRGTRNHPRELAILVLAGHADSQRLGGSGTRGEAAGIKGAIAMDPTITDELYWNLLTAQRIVKIGSERGLNIRYYDPGLRTIRNTKNPRSNWSVGSAHAELGGYVLEIHYDAYSPHGIGAGIIPAVRYEFSRIDEALAEVFGGYPYNYRGILGAPRRGISMLEIDRLEGVLERNLRDPLSRDATLNAIAELVVQALQKGLADGASGGATFQQ